MTDNNDDGFKSKGFDYDSLVEDGLKDVVKRVLKITSETGLIGNSHFFISFNGDDPDVIVPNELKTTDSSEIKIIIQHQVHLQLHQHMICLQVSLNQILLLQYIQKEQ